MLLRSMVRLDIFPSADGCACSHLRKWPELQELMDYKGGMQTLELWRPYSGLINFHLLLKRLDEEGYLSL